MVRVGGRVEGINAVSNSSCCPSLIIKVKEKEIVVGLHQKPSLLKRRNIRRAIRIVHQARNIQSSLYSDEERDRG
jgi:hypothetical protein